MSYQQQSIFSAYQEQYNAIQRQMTSNSVSSTAIANQLKHVGDVQIEQSDHNTLEQSRLMKQESGLKMGKKTILLKQADQS